MAHNTIILLGLNARFSHLNLALYYLRNHADDLGYDLTVMQYSINNKVSEIASSILAVRPVAVAISVYIWNSVMVEQLVSYIKENDPGIVIVLGGPEVSYNPESWLSASPGVDYIITGQGEAGFRELVKGGLKSEKRIISVENPRFEQILFPYREADFSGFDNKIIYYESSRGCPYHCSYCLSSRLDQPLEFRDIGRVKDELRFLIKFSPRIIKFVDRTFNVRPDRARSIWRFIVEQFSGRDTTFHCEIFPDQLEEEDYSILSSAPRGLFQFEIGVQSVHDEVLAGIGRKSSWAMIKPKIRRLIEMGNIHIHVDLIAGLPGEDWESLQVSFNEIYVLHADYFQVGFLKVLPGTKMREEADSYEMDYSTHPPYAIIRSRWLASENIGFMQDIAHAVDDLYNTGGFRTTLKELEAFFSSPIDLYKKIIFYAASESGREDSWEHYARLIIGITKEHVPDCSAYILDCLRWDWCITAKLHHYPQTLRSWITDEAKKRGYIFFKKMSEKNMIRYHGFTCAAAELRTAIFFKPATREFSGKYCEGNEMAMVLKGSGRMVFFNT